MTTINEALERIAKGITSGAYRHVKVKALGDIKGPVSIEDRAAKSKRAKRKFCMSVWAANTPCGTVCCIGGWLEYELGARVHVPDGSSLLRLCYPSNDVEILNDVTPEQCARAIRNFIKGKPDPWHGVRKDLQPFRPAQ